MEGRTKTIEKIVKSKQMTGEHSHRARVEVEGLGGVHWPYELEWGSDRVIRTDGDNVDKWGGGNFITRSDGKILATYNNRRTGEIFLSVVEDEDTLFGTTNALEENEWVFTRVTPAKLGGNVRMSYLQKLPNEDILLYILDYGVKDEIPTKLKAYKSLSGLGTEFEYLATIREYLVTGNTLGDYGGLSIGEPISLSSGRLIVPSRGYVKASGTWRNTNAGLISYSDDNGLTWETSVVYSNLRLLRSSCNGVAKFKDRLVINAGNYLSENMWFFYSDDEGESWKRMPRFSDPRGLGYEGGDDLIIWDGVDTNFWVNFEGSYAVLYALPDDIDFPTDASGYDRSGSFWQRVGRVRIANMYNRTLFSTEEGNLAIMGISTGSSVRLLGGTLRDKPPKALPVTDISISKTKGMIGSSQVTIENKNGEYAPDGTDNPRVLIPNKKIKIYQGYGENMHQTFTGLIDSIDMNTFPQLLTIKSRDMLKLAKDQMITYKGHNTITFNNNTIEEIFNRLAGLAGLDLGQVDIPNLSITQKQFTWETYLDAMSWLEELIGYHLYCDNKGLVHFVKDGVPETVEVAHEFREGEDIVSLSYSIDDADLYRKVIAFGEDENEEVIRVEKDFPAANYWNLPEDKILKIDVRDADTVDKVTRIVDDAIYLMQVRARTVQFECIAVPDLDIGDFITVTEQSSTVSEVYRITGMSSSQDADRYIMNLTCYHHGQQKE